ncbi:MAG: PH-like domain-containing protein [Galactobacter sp.]
MSGYGWAVLWTVLAGVLLCALMLLGWFRRGRRQADLPRPADVPERLGEPRTDIEGTYVVTTTAGDRLDRIAAHGLGVRGNALLSIGADGVAVLRQGSPSFFIPAQRLELIGTTSNMVGKAVEKDGIVVIRHSVGETSYDTGFRVRHHTQQIDLLTQLNSLLPGSPGDDTTKNSTGKENL